MPFALPATSWKHQSTPLYLHKSATLPRRPLRHEQTEYSQVGIFFVCKVPDFAYQLYGGMCHLGLQRRPVSANRCVLSFKGWPPCSLAICAKKGGNQVTDCHPVGGIFCLQPAAAKLHLAYQKVVLFAQPLANSLLSQNRKHSASLTASLFVPAGC